MSMPTKGQHHHHTHHQSAHHSHVPSQHIIGVNISQSTATSGTQSSYAQHYNPAILNTSPRFVSHSGTEFHVPGQNFGAQASGQVGGGGGSTAIPSGRGPTIGGIQPIGQSPTIIPPAVSSSGPHKPQIVASLSVKSQLAQSSSAIATTGHTPSQQEMGKQSHIQTQPSSMYPQNQSRSASQNYYSTGPRNQQSRNLGHRSGPQPVNQTQVVGIPGVGSSSGQPPAIYPHPSIAIQPSTVYVQGQVSGLHPSPHQSNVFPVNSQMPMQYTGPPQRHQTHQNQFPYQSYPAHTLIASNLFGYTHSAQHHGYYYPPTSAQMNLRGTSGNSMTNTSQHLTGTLNNTQGAAIVPQGTLQQSQQATQAMHGINVSMAQQDMYSTYNNTFNSSMSTKSKRQRSKAITDIVNPDTGKNISAEIYEEGHGLQNIDSSQGSGPQGMNNNAVAADFAARVAKLASETILVHQSSTKLKEADICDTNPPKKSGTLTDNPHGQMTSVIDSGLVHTVDPSSDLAESHKSHKNSQDQLNETDDERTIKPLQILPTAVVEKVLRDNIDLPTARTSDAKSHNPNLEVFQQSRAENLPPSNETTINASVDGCQIYDGNPILPNYAEQARGNLNSPISIIPSPDEDSVEMLHGSAESRIMEANLKKTDTSSTISESKNMQKQKNKNKVKIKDLNKEGIEKEGNEMDAFINVSLKIEPTNLQLHSEQEPSASTGITDKIEGSINQEVEKDFDQKREPMTQHSNKNINDEYDDEKLESTQKVVDCVGQTELFEVPEHESIFAIVAQKNEENAKSSEFVDVASIVPEKSLLKQDEPTQLTQIIQSVTASYNILTSTVCPSNSSIINEAVSTPTVAVTIPTVAKTLLVTPSTKLKYIYSEDQWSPINTTGKKVYGREFLMKLQNDPNSKIKPLNLPDLDVVLKDNSKARSPVDLKLRDANIARHDSLFPGFAVRPSSMSAKPLPVNKKSHSGKLKASKPNVIHVSLSLRDDVKLRETENAWKPTRLLHGNISEEKTKTDALYKRVRSVLNKLTPQKFETLVNQVRELQIDTQERLQGVIDLVFEKAVDEPNFSVAYALMCRELANMQVTGCDVEDSTSANFRKLILTRCQTEFQKNAVNEKTRTEKLNEIDECLDVEKKKELQANLNEEDRRMRMKSVGNIRFIGELFKQNMLTSKIMHQCIQHLLKNFDEENLECLCKLLTTIGKALESKNVDLSEYFKQMQQIANRKGKVSSRIRFMLQDVIDLKADKWVPRRDDSNPKTMDQIQREAELERLEVNNVPSNTSRKDDRPIERKRNRGGAASLEEGGWSQPVGRTRQVYSVETSKLKNKPPSMDDMQLGSRSTYVWQKPNPKITTPNKFSYLENSNTESDKRVSTIHLSGSRSTGPRDYGRVDYSKTAYESRNPRNTSYPTMNNSTPQPRENSAIESSRSQSVSIMTTSKTTASTAADNRMTLSEQDVQVALNGLVEEYVEEEDIEATIQDFKKIFPVSSHSTFVREIINAILEKPDQHRKKTSQLLAQLLHLQCMSLQHFKNGLEEIIEAATDLIIDIPKLWKYLAKILVHPISNGTYPLTELRSSLQSLPPDLKNGGHAAELLAEILSELNEVEGETSINEKWISSGLQWNDFVDDELRITQIKEDYKLDFLSTGCSTSLSYNKIHEKISTLLRDSNFDAICDWIQANLDKQIREPKFIRLLMTTILETSIEQCNDKWIFKVEIFDKLQKLIQRYVDADDYLELQCLFAVQAYIHKLSHPAGLLLKIMTYLCENNVLSNEAFLAWEKNEDASEREGKSVAVVSLKSFFIPLKEAEDISSGDEA